MALQLLRAFRERVFSEIAKHSSSLKFIPIVQLPKLLARRGLELKRVGQEALLLCGPQLLSWLLGRDVTGSKTRMNAVLAKDLFQARSLPWLSFRASGHDGISIILGHPVRIGK